MLFLSRLFQCFVLRCTAIPSGQAAESSECRCWTLVKASKLDHIIPILHSLHWLLVSARIQYKISPLCYSYLSHSGPEYLSKVLQIKTPSRQLRSSSDNRILRVPSVKTKTFGQRSFSYAGPMIWNKLPYDIRNSRSKASFRRTLKPHLFAVLC